MSENTDTIQPGDMAEVDAEGYDFAAALDDQLCVPCILCNCQGCDACVPYGIWTAADKRCVCEEGSV